MSGGGEEFYKFYQRVGFDHYAVHRDKIKCSVIWRGLDLTIIVHANARSVGTVDAILEREVHFTLRVTVEY